jgi:cation transport ATPase
VQLTGDGERAATTMAAWLGIPAGEVFAQVRPDGRADIVRRLRVDGEPVAMAGNGSTTRPRSPRPTSAWRSAPAPTPPSAPPI